MSALLLRFNTPSAPTECEPTMDILTVEAALVLLFSHLLTLSCFIAFILPSSSKWVYLT